MKIELGPEDNTWKILDEVYWILKNRKTFNKNKKCELKPYTKYVFEINMIFLFILIIDIVFMFCAKTIGNIIILSVLVIFMLLWDFFVLFYIYRKTKKTDGFIELNEKGISNFENGTGITFSWDKVDYVVIGKEALVIMFDKPICFYLNVKYSKDVISEMKKYVKCLRIFR